MNTFSRLAKRGIPLCALAALLFAGCAQNAPLADSELITEDFMIPADDECFQVNVRYNRLAGLSRFYPVFLFVFVNGATSPPEAARTLRAAA